MWLTIYPGNMQKIMFKYFIVWATQKRQMCISEYVTFKSTNCFRFCQFSLAHNTKNFITKILHMLVDYIIDYIQIYFHKIFTLINIIFVIFQTAGSPAPRSQIHFPSNSKTVLL
jgi:hypothetical protein